MTQNEFTHIKKLLEYGINEVFVHADEKGHTVYLAFKGAKSMKEMQEAAGFLSDTKPQMDIFCGSNDKFDVSLRSNSLPESINIDDISFSYGSLRIPPLREKFKEGNVKVYLYSYGITEQENDKAGNVQERRNDERAQIPLDVSDVRIHA